MKKMLFAAALLAATTITANATNVNIEAEASRDSIVVINNDTIDNSVDEIVEKQFINTEKDFEEKSNRSAIYQDRRVVTVADKAPRISLTKRDQRGFFLAPSVSILATLGENSFVAPKIGLEGGYEGNKHNLYGAVYYLKARPNEQSDLQGSFNALSAEFGYGFSVAQALDHHLRLIWRTDAIFQTTMDRQDLGRYESVSVQETEKEIITTTERGWRAYKVEPFMFGAKTGPELSYQFYNLPIAISAGANVGFISQIAGKESVNGSADGIGYKLTIEGKLTFRVYLHGKVKNMKAINMIRH